MKLKLTDMAIRNLPPPEKGQKSYYDLTFPTLALRVSQGGTKTFVMEIGQRGKRTLKTLGRYPQLSLADARALARQLQVRPSPTNASVTFREALGAYFSTECRNMGERHRNEVQRILTKQFSIIHAKPLPDLQTCDLTAIIDKMTPSVANHAYGAIKTFLTWCRRRNLILSNPLEDMNVPYKMQSRDRILTDDELYRIWHATSQLGTFGLIVQMLICTGCRRGEITSLRKEWIQGDVIVFPRATMKGKQEHVLPIPSIARDLLKSLPNGETRTDFTLIFTAMDKPNAPFSGWSKSKKKLDQLSGVSNWVLHDLRRTFRSNLSRWRCCSSEIAEMLIAHQVGNKIRRIYDRYEYLHEKREAMLAYDAHLKRVLQIP